MRLRRRDGQSHRERGQLRDHLRELERLREERLRDLGGLALEMHGAAGFEGRRLWAKAAEIAAIDDEANLVRRGLEEGLTLEELDKLARQGVSRPKTRAPEGAPDTPAPAPGEPAAPPASDR
jgi:hypothetical protein